MLFYPVDLIGGLLLPWRLYALVLSSVYWLVLNAAQSHLSAVTAYLHGPVMVCTMAVTSLSNGA